ILVDANRSRVWLADFGIACAEGRVSTLTRPGVALGTATYMSPEQARGGDITSAADRYSLGIVAFELLARTVPFRADTFRAVVAQHILREPPCICTLDRDLPPAVDAVVARMLAKAPDERYATCTEFVADLEQAFREQAQRPRVRAGADVAPASHRPVSPTRR